MHPHKDMEIITYVREGAIEHQDSLGNKGRTAAGDVQVMSAGTGITHAEMAGKDGDTKLFQIWIHPRARHLQPRWEQAEFPKQPVTDALNLLVSGREKDADKNALTINQDAAIYGGRLTKGTRLSHAVSGDAYIVLSEGAIRVNGTEMSEGDGAEVADERDLVIEALEDTVLLVIEMDGAQQKAA
jgi:redox-sensitive bicupin YhaK (pirin superfamily)